MSLEGVVMVRWRAVRRVRVLVVSVAMLGSLLAVAPVAPVAAGSPPPGEDSGAAPRGGADEPAGAREASAGGPERTGVESSAVAPGGPPAGVVPSWTPTSRRWANGDGTWTVELFSKPVFFQDRQDRWLEMDPTLVAGGTQFRGRQLPEAAARVARSVSPGQPVVRVGAPGRRVQVRYPALERTAAGELVDDGRTVRYPGVLAGGADLRVTLNTDGFKEEVVWHDRASARASYEVEFVLPAGLEARDGEHGVELVGADGAPEGLFSYGVAFDAAGVETGVRTSLVGQQGAVAAMRVAVDEVWLGAEERVFPVTIDPTYTMERLQSGQSYECTGSTYWDCDVYVNSDAPTGKYWEQSELRLGSPGFQEAGAPAGTNNRTRTFVMFWSDSYGDSWYRFPVESATLTMYAYWASSTNLRYFDAYGAASWPTRDTSWSNQPARDGHPYTGWVYQGGTGYYNWDVRSWAERWMNGPATNYGLRLEAWQEHDTASFRRFRSGNSGFSSAPRLVINYINYPPDTPDLQFPANNALRTTAPDYLRAIHSDANGSPGTVSFELHRQRANGTWDTGFDSGPVHNVANGTSAYFYPAATIDAGYYRWRAQACDGHGDCSSWASYYYFRVNTPPDVPTDLSPDAGADVYTTTPTLSGRFSDPDGDDGRLRFQIRPVGSSTTPAFDEGDTVASGQLSSFTVPAGRLAVDVSYEWRALARDVHGSQSAATAWRTFTVRDLAGVAPGLDKTIAPDRAWYAAGERVTYGLAVTNPAGASMTDVAVTDLLAAEVVAVAGSVRVDGQSCDEAGAVCVLDGNQLTVTALTIPAGATRTVTFDAVLAGDGRGGCSTVVNAATATQGTGVSQGSVPATVCDTGLGLEGWWSYARTTLGSDGVAAVNVANGNLVAQHLDTPVVQARGRLGFVLRRTYNSQATTAAAVPGGIGANWMLAVGHAGDLAGVSAAALAVPPAETAASPGAVTLVDRDGTRHVFRPRLLSAPVSVAALGAGDPRAVLAPAALSAAAGSVLCVDVAYDPPAGVQLGLWRYVSVPGSDCAAGGGELAGFAAVRQDRVRSEFAATGQLLALTDANGNELAYRYETDPAPGLDPAAGLGRLISVHEPGDCADPTDPACRAFRFAYETDAVVVTDPAGRATRYVLAGDSTARRLVRVELADGTTWRYEYCDDDPARLCAVLDHRGARTTFDYEPAPAVGVAVVAGFTDRRGTTTSFDYTDGTATTVDRAGQRRRYTGIDDAGRVAELREGATDGTLARHSTFDWDRPGVTCTQPDARVDNNLCGLRRLALDPASADQETRFTYNPEGQLLIERQLTAGTDLVASFGYRTQYIQPDGTVVVHDDTIAGGGQVVSDGGPARGASALFAISDRTEALTPRGNAAGAGFEPFLTRYRVDNNPAVPAGHAVPAGTCADPAAPVGNTGNLCETAAPSSTGAGPAVTRHRYDTHGQRVATVSPKAIAETPAGQTPPATTYTYFATGDRDLTGTVSAAGWLRAVTDTQGRFVAFGYDRAGNQVRAWDRNATAGRTVAEFPGTPAAPPSPRFAETRYAPGADWLSAPGRWVHAERDPAGNLTTTNRDPNGNPVRVRPPRGNAAGTDTFDTTAAYGPDDQITDRLTPAGRAATPQAAWHYDYDARGNRTAQIDPDGAVTAWRYDTVNRAVATLSSRGTDPDAAPAACPPAGPEHAPIPAGEHVCVTTTAYDGHDQPVTVTDPEGARTRAGYDATGRATHQLVDRDHDGLDTVRTAWLYDADGNVVTECRPRQATDGTGGCHPGAVFATHTTYTPAGQPATTTTHRGPSEAVTTSYGYDADGNQTTLTDPNGAVTTTSFDLDGRRVTHTVPRGPGEANTTTWHYDPAGNVTGIEHPPGAGGQARRSAFSYDWANRPLDAVTGADTLDAAAAGPATGAGNTRTRVAYDPDGNVVARYSPRAFTASSTTADERFVVRTGYDAEGRPVAQWVPRYDTARPNQDNDPTQAAECPTGAPGYPADVGVCVTRAHYDTLGRLTRLEPPGPAERHSTYRYTPDGLLAETDAPSPTGSGRAVTRLRHDGAGRPVEVIDPLGRVWATEWTADGLVTAETAPAHGTLTHVSSYGYDADGNRTRTLDAAGQTATVTYTPDGLVAESADTGGNTTRYTYDPAGNPTEVHAPSAVAGDATNPLGLPTRYTYTADRLLAAVAVPATGDGAAWRTTTYAYDSAGRKTTQHTAMTTGDGTPIPGSDGGTLGFEYHPNDRLALNTGRQGQRITYSYDPPGNLIAVTDDTTGTPHTITAEWYLDDLVATTNDGARTSRYAYTAAGQPTRRAHDGGTLPAVTATYDYNHAGLPTTAATPATGGNFTWAYDPAGRLTAETQPNANTVALDWNPNDTLAAHTLRNTVGVTLAQHSYTYDELYRIRTQTHTGQGAGLASPVTGTHTYTYDPAGRLATFNDGAATHTLEWDANSNRTRYGEVTYTYNPDDTIAAETRPAEPPRLHLYHPAGGLATDGCRDYGYDGHDRTQRIAPTTAPHPGCEPAAPEVTYTYDGLDRQQATTAGSGAGAVTTTIHHDGLGTNPAARSTSGLPAVTYTLDPAGTPRAVTTLGTSTEILTDDGTGTTATVTTPAGAIACTARHDPFGNPRNPNPLHDQHVCNTGTATNDIWYRATRRDPTTGTYQYGTRTYDPTKAAFTTPDSYRTSQPHADLSIGTDPLTRNTYTYVNGDPINLYDPDGHAFRRWRERWGIKQRRSESVTIEVPAGTGSPTAPRAFTVAEYEDWIVGTTFSASASGDRDDLFRAFNRYRAACSRGYESACAALTALTSGEFSLAQVRWVDKNYCREIGRGGRAECGLVDVTDELIEGAFLAGGALALARGGLTVALRSAAPRALGSADDLVAAERHLDSIGALSHPPNRAMLDRIASAQQSGRALTQAERNFLRHELAEANYLRRGLSLDEAHRLAGRTHPTFSNYDPEVIKAFPEHFNSNWRRYWGIE